MSRKWIGGLLAVAVLAGGAAAATSVLGADGAGSPRPAYATVDVDLSKATPQAARPSVQAKKKKKNPKLVYLQSPAPVTINPADPAAGGVGPFVDVRLTGCSKVVEGGVVANRADVFVQGTSITNAGEYHVFIGLNPGSSTFADRTPFTITSHLTCLKGVK
jgi:hypothetical protein